jgi:site-specific recombinase XerD
MTWRTVHYVVAEAGKAAGIGFQVHPHMLRHGTGFYLANAGQDTRAIQLYLGHKNIQHAVRARTCVRSSTFLKQRILDTGASRVGV